MSTIPQRIGDVMFRFALVATLEQPVSRSGAKDPLLKQLEKRFLFIAIFLLVRNIAYWLYRP